MKRLDLHPLVSQPYPGICLHSNLPPLTANGMPTYGLLEIHFHVLLVADKGRTSMEAYNKSFEWLSLLAARRSRHHIFYRDSTFWSSDILSWRFVKLQDEPPNS